MLSFSCVSYLEARDFSRVRLHTIISKHSVLEKGNSTSWLHMFPQTNVLKWYPCYRPKLCRKRDEKYTNQYTVST